MPYSSSRYNTVTVAPSSSSHRPGPVSPVTYSEYDAPRRSSNVSAIGSSRFESPYTLPPVPTRAPREAPQTNTLRRSNAVRYRDARPEAQYVIPSGVDIGSYSGFFDDESDRTGRNSRRPSTSYENLSRAPSRSYSYASSDFNVRSRTDSIRPERSSSSSRRAYAREDTRPSSSSRSSRREGVSSRSASRSDRYDRYDRYESPSQGSSSRSSHDIRYRDDPAVTYVTYRPSTPQRGAPSWETIGRRSAYR